MFLYTFAITTKDEVVLYYEGEEDFCLETLPQFTETKDEATYCDLREILRCIDVVVFLEEQYSTTFKIDKIEILRNTVSEM